jgi:putative copper resistance protein D
VAFDLLSAQLAATIMLNLSVAVVMGANMAFIWLRGASSPWAARHAVGLRTAVLAAAGVALVAHVAVLWLEAASMAEVPVTQAAPAVRSVLTATHYGLAWTIGMCALALVAGVTAIRWRSERSRADGLLRLLAIGVFLYSRSMVSHAGAGGDVSWAVAVDWLHLVLISLWVGEVLVAGLITLRKTSGSNVKDRRDCARYVEALSNSATVALTGIFVTGTIGAWRGLGALDNATGNPYAATLLIKVALVSGAAMLGGVNRFFVMPRVLANLRRSGDRSDAAERRFALVLQIEALFLLAALVLAAVLSSTSPPSAV